MRNMERFFSPADRMVLEAIRSGYATAEEIRYYCREHGVEVERMDTHTRRLKRWGYIIRKTSDYKYSNVWEVM